MERWIYRLACLVLPVTVWAAAGSGDEADPLLGTGPLVVATVATFVALAVAWRARLAERWALPFLLAAALPPFLASAGWRLSESFPAEDLVIALLWISPLPLLVSMANETSRLVEGRQARNGVLVGSLIGGVLFIIGFLGWIGDGSVVVLATGVLCLALAVVTMALACGRAVLAWLGSPVVILSVVAALVIFLPSDDDGIFLPFLLTVPIALFWAIFAVVAWGSVQPRDPAPAV